MEFCWLAVTELVDSPPTPLPGSEYGAIGLVSTGAAGDLRGIRWRSQNFPPRGAWGLAGTPTANSWLREGWGLTEIIPASAFEPGGVAMQYYLPPQPVRPSNWSEFDPSNYDVFLTDTAPAINFALDEYPNFCARFYGDTSARYSGWIAAPTSGESKRKANAVLPSRRTGKAIR